MAKSRILTSVYLYSRTSKDKKVIKRKRRVKLSNFRENRLPRKTLVFESAFKIPKPGHFFKYHTSICVKRVEFLRTSVFILVFQRIKKLLREKEG